MTDSEKIDKIHKNMERVFYFQAIVVTITVLGFLGYLSVSDLFKKTK